MIRALAAWSLIVAGAVSVGFLAGHRPAPAQPQLVAAVCPSAELAKGMPL